MDLILHCRCFAQIVVWGATGRHDCRGGRAAEEVRTGGGVAVPGGGGYLDGGTEWVTSNVSVVRVLRMERVLEIADELRIAVKRGIGDKYGDRVLPMLSFVDYAMERGSLVELIFDHSEFKGLNRSMTKVNCFTLFLPGVAADMQWGAYQDFGDENFSGCLLALQRRSIHTGLMECQWAWMDIWHLSVVVCPSLVECQWA